MATQPLDIQIVTQNSDFVVVNKPQNTSFHAEENVAGFFSLVENHLQTKLWPVHRLDKVTSGLLIFALNKDAASTLSELFARKQVRKTYLAISDKKPKKKQGKIVGDMEKSRGGSWKLVRQKDNPAITRFFSAANRNGERLFWLLPETGKTHQLRVAMKSLGSPILGDARYGGSSADRCYLHAYQLSFPWRDEIISIQCLPINGEKFTNSEFPKLVSILSEKSNG